MPVFCGGKGCYFIPGDPELYAFPSPMYQQLQTANTQRPQFVKNLLLSLRAILKPKRKR